MYYIAWNNEADQQVGRVEVMGNPNPHALNIQDGPFDTFELAYAEAERLAADTNSGTYELPFTVVWLNPERVPEPPAEAYAGDLFLQLVYSTLVNREIASSDEIRAWIDGHPATYPGDLYFAFGGPMLDSIEAAFQEERTRA